MWTSLTNALARCRADAVNTWYFVGHVDSFRPRGRMTAAYTESREYRRALADYEALLTDVFDPLVRKGYVRWATPSRMRQAYEARERK